MANGLLSQRRAPEADSRRKSNAGLFAGVPSVGMAPRGYFNKPSTADLREREDAIERRTISQAIQEVRDLPQDVYDWMVEGARGGMASYNEALTGRNKKGERVPGILRALTLAAPGSPPGVAGTGMLFARGGLLGSGSMRMRGGKTSARPTDDAASVLTSKQLDKLEEAKKLYPRFGEASQYMMPLELGPVLNSAYGPRNVERLLEILPNAENFAAAAKMGSPKRGWYKASAQSIHDVFGSDAPRFASLLAATSPQNSVEMNMMNALSIWKNWTAAGRPKDLASVKEIMGASVTGEKGQDSVLDAWVNNTVRALGSKDPVRVTLSGPKVDSFFRNLVGDVQRVTNDAHMANFSGIRQGLLRVSPSGRQLAAGNPGMTPAYASMSALQRQAAERLGYTPANVQESIWSLTKPLTEKQAALNMPARDILQKGLLTTDDIRGTVDFASLMKDPNYANILERAGYGSQLDALKPVRFGDNAPNLNLAEQNELMNTAARIEYLGALRGRESAAKQFAVPRSGPKSGERAHVYATEEVVPGEDIGHLPRVLKASEGEKAHLTSRVRGALTDPQGMDILHRNLGLPTIATRAMQGAWRASPKHKIQFSPGYAAGVELPLTKAGRLTKRDEQKLRTAATVRGAMTAQHGSPYSGLLADARGTDLIVPKDTKLSPSEIRKYVAKKGLEDAAIVDYGKGAGLLNWTGKPYTFESAKEIGNLLGSIKRVKGKVTGEPVSARNVVDPDMSYVDLQSEWLKAPGSRAVTNRMMAELDKLGAAGFKRLDQKNIRQAAGDIHKVYASKAKKGESVREDLMNLLTIVRDKGLAGLRKAVKAKEFLPSIAAIGLAPTVYRMSQPADRKPDG